MDQNLTPKEIAAELSVCERFVRQLIYDHKLAFERHGSRVMIPRSALEAYRQSVTVMPFDATAVAARG